MLLFCWVLLGVCSTWLLFTVGPPAVVAVWLQSRECYTIDVLHDACNKQTAQHTCALPALHPCCCPLHMVLAPFLHCLMFVSISISLPVLSLRLYLAVSLRTVPHTQQHTQLLLPRMAASRLSTPCLTLLPR